MDKFTASNGGTVKTFDTGRVSVTDVTEHRLSDDAKVTSRTAYLEPGMVDALREFFRAEEDERLGWWRCPSDPHIVCVEGPVDKLDGGRRTVYVFDEETFGRFWMNDRVLDVHHTPMQCAARDFLLAHPVAEPKPWLDAKPGQIWEVTTRDGGEKTLRYAVISGRDQSDEGHSPYFVPVEDLHTPKLGLKATVITAATRIYPKEEA